MGELILLILFIQSLEKIVAVSNIRGESVEIG